MAEHPLDEWLEGHARIHPGELAHMSQPINGSGRYRRGGSARSQSAQR